MMVEEKIETPEQTAAWLKAAYRIVAEDLELSAGFINGWNADISSEEYRKGADDLFELICKRGFYVPKEEK